MRGRGLLLSSLLALSAPMAAQAAVPDRIVALLGPSVGYLLSQDGLWAWGMSDRIRTTYGEGFTAIGMTQAQQTTAWDLASATQRRLAAVSAEAKERLKADTCTDVARQRVEGELRD